MRQSFSNIIQVSHVIRCKYVLLILYNTLLNREQKDHNKPQIEVFQKGSFGTANKENRLQKNAITRTTYIELCQCQLCSFDRMVTYAVLNAVQQIFYNCLIMLFYLEIVHKCLNQ